MLDSYKGIKRGQSKEIFYWLDNYCKDTNEQILENDIVLQDKVKKFKRKRFLLAITFNIVIWSLLIYTANELTKG